MINTTNVNKGPGFQNALTRSRRALDRTHVSNGRFRTSEESSKRGQSDGRLSSSVHAHMHYCTDTLVYVHYRSWPKTLSCIYPCQTILVSTPAKSAWRAIRGP